MAEHSARMLPADAAWRHPVQILTSGPDNGAGEHPPHVRGGHQCRDQPRLAHHALLRARRARPDGAHQRRLRGLDVQLLVPRKSDSAIVSAAARSYFDELIAAGVKVWEYRAGMLHSKTMLIDDNCAFIGTANFDNRSFRLNFEVCAVVYGPALAEPLARQFEADLLVPHHRHHAAGVPGARHARA
jgi:cardiolipin synthase